MLVVLYFHQLGYSPLDIALLFLFHEFFGMVTNLAGGWLVARLGLNMTLISGTLLQIAALLMLIPIGIVIGLEAELNPGAVLIVGLGVFGIVFAINSAVHCFLILDYAESDRVAMKVGFYYMAIAGGRLVGTVLSGWIFMTHGLIGCLIASAAMLAAA